MSGPLIAFVVLVAAFALWRMHRAVRAAAVADWGNGFLNWLDGLNRLYCHRYHRLRSEPLPLPARGPALVVANHISGVDPMLMIAASPRPLRFLIAAEQYHRFGLTWLFRAIGCIPVERSGRAERPFRAALHALEAGEVVALFPEGGIHLEEDRPRRLKPGVAKLAELTGAPVFPARVSGTRGQGLILRSLLLRAHARLDSFPPVDCAALGESACLDRLKHLLHGTASPAASPTDPLPPT